MKFILLVEGQTEREAAKDFLKRWLDVQLKERGRQPVGIQVAKFNGYARLLDEMGKRARLHLDGPSGTEIIAVIGLLDLYIPEPNFYPPDKTTADDRYAWGKQHFEGLVSIDRFRLFFAVHEFEAWLLSNPEIFPGSVKNRLPRKKTADPERVDFGVPPSRLLDRTYRQAMNKGYKKTVDGQRLFAKLDPNVAAQKCPYLNAMLQDMLKLALGSGA